MSTNDKIQLAIISLLQKDRFHAGLLQRMRRIKASKEKCPTAGVSVTDQINLYYNEEFVNSLSLLQCEELLKHECAHIYRDHISRGHTFNAELNSNVHRRLNISADAAINHDLPELTKEFGVTIPRLNEQLKQINPKAKDLEERQAMEHYYHMLSQFIQDNQDSIDQMLKEMGQVDDHSLWEESDDPELVKEIIKREVNKAVEQAGGIGNVSSEIASHINELNKSKVNWRQQLRQFFVNSTYYDKEPTRKKRNRRYGTMFQGKKKKPALKIAVCIDTSGSVSDEELAQFYAELKAIHTMVQPEIWMIQADCEVKHVELFDPKKTKPDFKGRGGTAYQPAITKALELNVDGIVFMGDMDAADIPNDPKKPFLWAAVRNSPAPAKFGRLIRIETEDKRR